MGDTHTVRLEPVGIDMDVDEDETILEAAFRQGLMLMHGCKEGQCSACKSYVLEGEDYEFERYSTFALADYEREQGLALLCRCHAYEDMQIELLHYDEDMLRSGVPIQEATAEVEAIESVTHDMRRLVLKLVDPPEMLFIPGQYADIFVPGTDSSRSFSMSNTPETDDHRLEFVIKVYPDGMFSGFLNTQLAVGDQLTIKGPYGMFTLRQSESDLIFIGGGAGMGPILSLLRSMNQRGVSRSATYYYGARGSKDLCYDDELRTLEAQLPDFRYVPALSEPDGESWEGPTGLVTDVVDEREGDLTGTDAYICGPPPMVEAAIDMLLRHGVDEERIYYDKFTTTGDLDT